MAYSEDHIALAAEYALGTLEADERAQVETMMSVDPEFTVIVEAWGRKLGVLNQMVGSVEPRPELWEKIRVAAGLSGPQAPIVLPDSPAPTVSVGPDLGVAARPANSNIADGANIVLLSAKARRWRSVATLTTALAAALLVMISVRAYRPDLLPGLSSGQRVQTAKQTTKQKPESQSASAAPVPSAQYVAVLQKDGGATAFILTVDGATKNFTVRKVDAPAEAGKSYELWLISDKLPRPRSLGVIGNDDFTSRPVLASYDTDTVKSATYAVTVEQAGGTPDGKPTSAPVFAGKLIESVPPAAR
jgi:anti-sigma-K factor RskA